MIIDSRNSSFMGNFKGEQDQWIVRRREQTVLILKAGHLNITNLELLSKRPRYNEVYVHERALYEGKVPTLKWQEEQTNKQRTF